jgi:hypothetical protein
MTAVESPAGSSTIPATKKTTLGKPERPDEEAFRKAEAVAKRELDDAQKALVCDTHQPLRDSAQCLTFISAIE